MTKPSADNQNGQPLGLPLNNQLGPAVPDSVLAYLHAYGDSRADEDGRSGPQLGATILALRRWVGEQKAAERARCKELADLAVEYAKDADWSRVTGVLHLLARGGA